MDIKGAYDNVVQGKLWEIMKRLKVENGRIKILKDIYRDDKVFITWEGKVTAPVEIKRGLRQGCPLLPLLFMMYLQGLEERLKKSGAGFDLS